MFCVFVIAVVANKDLEYRFHQLSPLWATFSKFIHWKGSKCRETIPPSRCILLCHVYACL